MKYIIFLFLSLSVSFPVFSSKAPDPKGRYIGGMTFCPLQKVLMLSVNSKGDLFYHTLIGTKRKAADSGSPAKQSYLLLLTEALNSGGQIGVKYLGRFDCSSTMYSGEEPIEIIFYGG